MSDVPSEIWLEVLSRLPVVDLLRFRCVSKPWKSLIDSNQFIRHHLNHSLNNPNSNLTIILKSFDLYSADFNLLKETNRAHFQELIHPLKTPFGGTQILGSCDGLLAISNGSGEDTILWNPSVRRFHEVPFESFEFLDVNYVSYGFGYDSVRDDYKLVRMVQVYGDDNYVADIKVKIYSLKSDSWKSIPDFPYYLRYSSIPGKFVNGALHWIVGKKTDSDTANLAIAFDLGTEEYRLVPLPEFVVDNDDMHMNVVVLGGCLGLKIYVDDNVDIWVMKEYGVQESWSFLFTFDISGFEFMTPIAYSKCKRKVLIGLDELVLMWYDLDEQSTNLPIIELPVEYTYDVHSCLQSLVLLNEGTCDFDLVTSKIGKSKGEGSRTRHDSRAEK